MDRSPSDRLLLRAARRAPGWTGVLALATLAGAAARLLFPAALATSVDAALGRHAIGLALARLATVLAVATLADAAQGIAGGSYAAATTAWLRHRLLAHALRLGVPGQRRFPAGDVLNRLTGDTPGAGQVLPVVLEAVVALASAAGAVVALALIDWRLAAAFGLGLPPALLLVRAFMVRASELFVRYRRLQAAVAARLVDALAGARTIRASGTAAREVDRVLAPLPELHATGMELWHAQRRVAWQAAVLVPLLEVVVLAAAGLGVAGGRVTPGELLAAAAYVRLALLAFEQLDGLAEAVRARSGATRVAEVLAAANGAGGTGRPLPPGRGAVRLRGVRVGAGDGTVLDGLDLDVPAGVSVALVGRSGAGKTTVAGLIGGLGRLDAGEVLLDGEPVAELDPAAVHGAVAYAFERPALLGATVHDAVAYARPTATAAEVERAARAAAADGFVRRLPRGYQTPLELVPLSGGEAQRLGLARAVAADARVLVLDDATSSLDTATEVQVSEALAEQVGERTCVMVAHRAATAARADLVAWLDRGRVRALAPHATLWADREYRALFGEPS